MQSDSDLSLSDEATSAGRPRPKRADVSLGDERTLGDGLSGQDTVIGDIEIVDIKSRYTIDGTLGQGGMGEVLLATDTRLGRKVAIKRILGEAAGNRMAVQRFLTEAKSIAALNHPNIVQIYDYGRAKDGPFLIMEFVDGGSLLDRCRDGAMPLEDAVDLACQLCDGLSKAHDLGIIHRDIKPANVLLTKDGTPKLTDFGLAKAQAGDHGQTMTGAVLGTPDFMPPEQRRDASEVDSRSDLWSLAATVYQMVTGRSPKVINLRHVPPQVHGVLGKALEDDKETRYQSVRDLRDALRAAVRAGPTVAPAATPVSSKLQEGQCSGCGTVNADLNHKFCRECGGPLRVPCLKCDTHIPVWDTICGECGGKQPSILAEKTASMQAKREAAEASLREHEYDSAVSAAGSIAVVTHPALSEFAAWGRGFVATATAERDRQLIVAAERLGEARSHVAAFDYTAAIHALEAIPDPIRAGEAGALLTDCVASRDESESLLRSIAARVQSRKLEGLMPVVERAIALRGDRADLQRILLQLVERRNKYLAQVKAVFDAGDSRAAWAAIAGASRDDLDEPSLAFVERVRYAAELEDRLAVVVKEAKASGKISLPEAKAILLAANLCLEANPANNKVLVLISQCEAIVHPGVLKNSVGIEMKLIPAGSFTMGDAAGMSDEKPHRVKLTRPFYIGVHEVTNAEWMRVMGSVPSDCKYDDLPVERVSWGDALEFCRKLSALPEEQAAGRVYRLPTEAEWEYACRAGTTTQFSFGDDSSRLGEYAWFNGNANNQSHAVGQKSPNAFGLCDMHGNVSEWCSDWYGDYPSDEVTDPTGPLTGSYRVYRGGCGSNNFKNCRSAYRSSFEPSVRPCFVGFRLAMSPSGAESPEGPKRSGGDSNKSI